MIRWMTRIAILATVTLVIPACGSGGGDGGDGGAAAVLEFVLGTGSGRTVTARGGRGTNGNGGQGGIIDIHHFSGGDGKVLRTGSIDTTFAVPNDSISLGANPRIITGNVVLGINAGTLTAGSSAIPGTVNPGAPATGLHVQAGATLTIRPNFPGGGAANTNAQLLFSDGALIEGAVVMGRQDTAVEDDGLSDSAAGLTLNPLGGAVVRSTGSISATGALVAGPGGQGGSVFLVGFGAIINRGSITTTGGAGTVGGNGGAVTLQSAIWGVYSTGPIFTIGGNGSAGLGGTGGVITFLNSSNPSSFTGGGCFISGDLTTTGGNGTAGGGAGGNVIRNDSGLDEDGPTVFNGNILASGGNGTAAAAIGGKGGDVTLIARGGHLRVSGTITSRGGTGNGATGGNGGPVFLAADRSAFQPSPIGVFVGATIDMDGGAGDTGGNGGALTVFNNSVAQGSFAVLGEDPMALVGYTTFDNSGGQGTVNGGPAALIRVQGAAVASQTTNFVRGSILNEVDFLARGGNGTAGTGGSGGLAVVESFPDATATRVVPDFNRTVVNRGAIDNQGGTGATTGGNGGGFFMFDHFHVENHGAVNTSGGGSGSGLAGAAVQITIQSDGITINNANLTAVGGSSTGAGNGNSGGVIFLDGQFTTHSGVIDSHGGSSVGGTGGNGPNVEIGSWNGVTLSTLTGSVNVAGGTGVTAGGPGIVTVDGVRRALTAGILTF